MVNKKNLIKIAQQPLMREFLIEFSKKVKEARDIEDYINDPRKRRFDRVIEVNNICKLDTKTYYENIVEIYNILCG